MTMEINIEEYLSVYYGEETMHEYHPLNKIDLTDYHTVEITSVQDDLVNRYFVGTMSEQSAKGFIRDYSDITANKIIFDDGPDYIAFCVRGRDNMDSFYDTLVNLI